MATITVQSIIDKAEIILQDTTNTRWPVSELLGWFNDGQREVVLLKPDANAQNEAMLLSAGTKQSIPPTGVQLIKVVRNMGIDGETAGNVVRLIDQQILDDQNEDWHAETGETTVKHYCFDERDPKTFYVWPPSDGTGYVEVVYAAVPADISIDDISGVISLDDSYGNALVDFILYRAYLKDVDYAGNAQRASAALSSFYRSLGRMDQVEALYNPNVSPAARAAAGARG